MIVVAVLWGAPFQIRAFFTAEDRMEATATFSDAFRRDYAAAIRSGDTNSLIAFENMLGQYKLPHEQAELEMVIGIRYGQTTGLVNPAKAVEHFGKALAFELPPIVRLQIHLWRGNSYEQLKRNDEALTEYLKGTLICLNYDLPQSKPKLGAIPALDWPLIGNDAVQRKAYEKAMAERKRQFEPRDKAMFDLKLEGLRFYVIDASKRVGGDANNVRAIARTILNDDGRVQKLVDLFVSPNKRLWE
jgi:hypothetical protein